MMLIIFFSTIQMSSTAIHHQLLLILIQNLQASERWLNHLLLEIRLILMNTWLMSRQNRIHIIFLFRTYYQRHHQHLWENLMKNKMGFAVLMLRVILSLDMSRIGMFLLKNLKTKNNKSSKKYLKITAFLN